MHSARVVMNSKFGPRQTLQYNGKPSGRHVKTAQLYPDSFGVGNPRPTFFQVHVNDVMSALPLIRLKSVVHGAECRNGHGYPLLVVNRITLSSLNIADIGARPLGVRKALGRRTFDRNGRHPAHKRRFAAPKRYAVCGHSEGRLSSDLALRCLRCTWMS